MFRFISLLEYYIFELKCQNLGTRNKETPMLLSEPKTSALFEGLVISLYLADLCEAQKFQHFAVMEKFDSDKQIVKMLPNLKQSQNQGTLGGP